MEPQNTNSSDTELYDHQVPKPAQIGLVLLMALLFFGGGQVVKGHWRRFFGLWAILIASLALTLVLGLMLTDETGRDVIPVVLAGAYAVVWFCQVWDAITHV
jgi:hypothetical protein